MILGGKFGPYLNANWRIEMRDLMKKFVRDERGVTLVEYGIAIALAVLVGTGALGLLGGEIGVALDAAGAAMPDPVEG